MPARDDAQRARRVVADARPRRRKNGLVATVVPTLERIDDSKITSAVGLVLRYRFSLSR